MVFRGKPSKACERCRTRRLRVSPNSRDLNRELRFDGGRSVTFRVVHVASVSEQMCLVQVTETRSSFAFKMKVKLLRERL